MLNYINELITVQIPDKFSTGYQIPTYENINSVYIVLTGSNLPSIYGIIGGATDIDSGLSIVPGKPWYIDGKKLEKLNAPITINFVVQNPTVPNNGIFIWIKRYI